MSLFIFNTSVSKVFKYDLIDYTMAKILVKKAIVRKPGFLYYVDGEGNVCEAKMARGRRKGGKKKK